MEPPEPPTVSIALPVYNGERFIRGALEMLARQTWTDYELIVIDNGSRDRTAAICREFAARDPRIRYLRFEGTIPPVDNYWRAFEHARGRYFLWNAADDGRPDDAVARAVAVLESRPEVVMVHGPVEVDLPAEGRMALVANDVGADCDDGARRVANYTARLRHNAVLYGVYRRTALQRARFRQHVGQDFLVGLQLALIGRIAYLDAPVIRYLHANGPIDDPMYRRAALTARSALAWPSNRFKCAIVLARGGRYLMQETGSSLPARLGATVAFVTAFVRRYHRHLAVEAAFAVTAPLAWLSWPLTERLRRARRAGAAA